MEDNQPSRQFFFQIKVFLLCFPIHGAYTILRIVVYIEVNI